MPQPTARDVHVNTPLTNISVAFLQDLEGFVSGKVSPSIPVQKQSDIYYKYDVENWDRIDAKVRAPATESAGGGYEVDNTPTYLAKVRAFHKDIDDQIRANADPVINMDRDATEFVTRQLMLRREKDWADEFFTTSVWTGSTTGGDITVAPLWDAGGSTPIEDMRAELTSVKLKGRRRPNKVIMGEEVWDVIADHPEFLDRIKGGAVSDKPAIVMPNLLAQVLRIEEVMIADAIENTATEGLADSPAFMFGKNVLLVFANQRPSIMQPSALYTFSWTGYLGGAAGPEGQVMSRFRMDQLRADRVEGEMAYAHELVSSLLGAFLAAVIS